MQLTVRCPSLHLFRFDWWLQDLERCTESMEALELLCLEVGDDLQGLGCNLCFS